VLGTAEQWFPLQHFSDSDILNSKQDVKIQIHNLDSEIILGNRLITEHNKYQKQQMQQFYLIWGVCILLRM
jgi:hypothetical protein